MKKRSKILLAAIKSLIIMIYVGLIIVLVLQALTPGEESSNISQDFGDRLNEAIGEISTPESSKIAVEGVEISSVTVGGEELFGDSVTINIGDLGRINGNAFPANATNRALEYFSSDEGVVEVYADGRVFAASVGQATVTVRSRENPDFSYSITVTVEKIALESISLESAEAEIAIGEMMRLDVQLYPENASEKALVWNSLSPDILTVDNDGAITPISEGEAIVTVSSKENPEILASIKITVTPEREVPTIPLEKIVLTLEENIFYVGELVEVGARLYPEGASGSILWYSSDEEVATVSQSGIVKLHKAGEVTITAKCGPDIVDSIKILVREVVSTDFIMNFEGFDGDAEDGYHIKQGSAGKLTVTLGENATVRDIKFTSSDEKIAKISPDGNIEALKGGNVTITVSTTNGETTNSVHVKITVTPLTLADTVDNFYYFIRKAMGHFGAFLVLGIFGSLTYYIIFKKSLKGKLIAFLTCIFAGFAVAGITEILQLPLFTYGRYCSFSDVLLDFVGYCTSTVPIFLFIIVIHLVIHIVKKVKKA